MTVRPEYLQRNVIQACLNDDWFILPRKLEQITAFLELRANGFEVDEETIKATMAESPTHRLRELVAAELGGEDWEEDRPVIVDGVQVLGLYGTLAPRMNLMMSFSGGTSTQKFSKAVDKAAENDKVRTILIDVDSPGGVVSGTEEARQAIKRATAKKRVVTVGRNIMASAAYYIGAAATQTFATPSTEVGSIGVYTILENVVEAAEKRGVKFFVFRAGDLKAAGNPYEHLTEERRDSIQARIDGAYQMFLAAVAEDRGVSVADVESRFGQGSVKLAAEAAAVGMIDGVRLIEDVLESERKGTASTVSIRQPSPSFVGANVSNRPASAGNYSQKESKMDPKIKAALFAAGVISAIDADDATCQAALNAWFFSRGQAVPESTEKKLAALLGGPQANTFGAGKPDTVAAVAAVTPPAPNVQAAHDREMAEAKRAAAVEERERIAAIEAAAITLNGGRSEPLVTDEMLIAAKASGATCGDVVAKWMAQAGQAEKPVNRVEVKGEGAELWAADAAAALEYRVKREKKRLDTAPKMSDGAAQMASTPLWILARQSLLNAGEKITDYESPADIAERAMKMHDGRRVLAYSPLDRPMWAGGAQPYGRPGDFPNLLSNLANKILDDAIELADATYPVWTGRVPGDLADFKPAPIVNRGQTETLDEVADAESFKQLTIVEEMLSYLYLRRFGNKIGWTPVLVANDDLGALTEDAYGLGEAWETTVNRLCTALLTANPALLVGGVLFAAGAPRGNNIAAAGGGTPSDAQWSAMEVLQAAQTGIDTNRRIRATLNTILLPTGLCNQNAKRTFYTWNQLAEVKQPITDATVNIYRGLVQVIAEPDLNNASLLMYYGMASPSQFRTATIVRAYFRGWGERGRRETWYDPENKTTWISLEGRVGAAIKNFRYVVRNEGA